MDKDGACVHCHGSGRLSRDCHHGITARAPPRLLTVPTNTASTIRHLSAFAIFNLEAGRPSVQELREMLAYRFNLTLWPHQIKNAAGHSFMVQFPSDALLAQAIELGLVDMGTFRGRFRRWREDHRLTTVPQPFLVWIRLFNVPYHLWNYEFLRTLLAGIGECIKCSRDVISNTNFEDCKVLLKVRDLSDIPKRLGFRYTSPVDGNIKEGYAVTQVLCRPGLERAQGSTRLNLGSQPAQPISYDPELQEVSWDGRHITVDREQWQRFLQNQGIGPSNLGAAHRTVNSPQPGNASGSQSSSSKSSSPSSTRGKRKRTSSDKVLSDIYRSSEGSNK